MPPDSTSLSESARSIIEAARLRVINRQNPLLESLPSWVDEFRPHQTQAIGEIIEAFSRAPVVVVDAPTGSGKTLLAESVRRMLRTAALYVCTDKGLQEQFLRDYPYAKLLKGRANYPTGRFPFRFRPTEYDSLSCEDCTWDRKHPECKWCERKSKCPYEIAKTQALESQLAVLNTSYWLTEVNNVGRFANWPLVIMDEADLLESQLMGYVSVSISPRRMEQYRWEPPEKVTVKESWGKWLGYIIPKIQQQYAGLPTITDDLRVLREAKYLANLHDKLTIVQLGLDDDYWVYTGKDKAVSFRPSRVDSLGKEYLWRYSPQFLLMSATIISASELLDSLGYEGKYEVVRVANTFPIKNRRVKIVPIADMSRKLKDVSLPSVAKEVAKIIAFHPNDRILIHTVSYDLAEKLMKMVVGTQRGAGHPTRKMMTYRNATGRENAIRQYLHNKAAVLFAPSLARGIDLPGEACRVQIIVKIPYPYLGDRQVSARVYSRGGREWYNIQTIRTLVQMTGRAVRSKEDHAVTYILDKQFSNGIWSRGRGLFPSWWAESLEWIRV